MRALYLLVLALLAVTVKSNTDRKVLPRSAPPPVLSFPPHGRGGKRPCVCVTHSKLRPGNAALRHSTSRDTMSRDTMTRGNPLCRIPPKAATPASDTAGGKNENTANNNGPRPQPPTSGRIVGGHNAGLGQFPYQALVISNTNRTCGGSLIKSTVVMTTGWCTYRFKSWYIRLGTIYRTKEDDESAWTTESYVAVTHPMFNRTGLYLDVGLIFLPREAPLNSFISVVGLPSMKEINSTFAGQRARVSGWGQLEQRGESSEILQWTDVVVSPPAVCMTMWNDTREGKLCAGNERKGFCHEDKGGPLVVMYKGGYKQIGIASSVEGSCDDSLPATYTRVTTVLDWILEAADMDDEWRK